MLEPRLGAGHPGRVADEIAECLRDPGHRREIERGPAAVGGVDDLVAQVVKLPRDAGSHPAGSEHLAVLGRRRRQARGGHPTPLARQGGIEHGGCVGEVGGVPTGGQTVQRGVHGEADDPNLSVQVDQHVLRHHPAVVEPGVVGACQAVGDLADDPRGSARLQGLVGCEHVVERGPLPPLVDDVAEVVGLVGVEHAQQPPVVVGRRTPCCRHQALGPLVGPGDEVYGDRSVQDLVVGQPEATACALGEQVVETVAAGEEVAGVDGVRHREPPSPNSRRRWSHSS